MCSKQKKLFGIIEARGSRQRQEVTYSGFIQISRTCVLKCLSEFVRFIDCEQCVYHMEFLS